MYEIEFLAKMLNAYDDGLNEFSSSTAPIFQQFEPIKPNENLTTKPPFCDLYNNTNQGNS